MFQKSGLHNTKGRKNFVTTSSHLFETNQQFIILLLDIKLVNKV